MAESPPVRIAFCITELDPGGAERALVHLVTRLEPARWERRVYCLSGEGPLVGTLAQAGIETTCIGARGARDVLALRRLTRGLKSFQPEIVQTWLHHANLAGRIAARLARVPHVVSGIRVAERRSRSRLQCDRATQSLVNAHVCVSEAVARFSRDQGRLDPRKIVVIPNGVDAELFAGAQPIDLVPLGVPAGVKPIIAVGRLDRQKGLDILLDAAAQVVRRQSDAQFLIVGEGPLRGALENRVRELELVDHVHFAGWRPDVPRLLRSSVGMALASRWEGLPNVILEAMAAGLPVVATHVEGVDELMDSSTGTLVPPESPGDLAAALLALLADPPRAAAMGRAGQERTKSRFSWENMAQAYVALYESLRAGRDVST